MKKLQLQDAKSINIEIKKEENEQSRDWWMSVYKTGPMF